MGIAGKVDLEKLTVSLLSPFIAGIIGAFFTSTKIVTWYDSLNKPSFNPPGQVFSIVWPILYIMMGVSLYLVWSKGWGKKEVRSAVLFFFVHLVFNAGWSIAFFGLESPLFGLVVIAALIIWVAVITLKFYRIEKIAGLLLVPYLLWVLFASFLNFQILILN